jgi:hypothetical protein
MYIFFGSSLNVEEIQKEIFIFQNYINARFYSELIKLLLPEIIVDYFELTSYKEVILHRYLKRLIQSLKNIGNLN